MRLKQRNSKGEKVVEQTLQARFVKKYGKEMWKNFASDEKSKKNSKNHMDSIKKCMDNKYSGKKVDMKEVQYYNSQGFDHYARDCRRKKKAWAKDRDEVQYAHAEDIDYKDVLLMVNTQSNTRQTNMWYLDSRCNNHMTSNKDCSPS